MSMKLYVGNLPFSIGENELRELFAQYGEIAEVTLIKDKFSGRSKGFGFVTLADDEQATSAIAEMNGKEVEGRAIKVNEAKPMDPENRPPRKNFGGSGGGNRRRF